MGAGGSKPETQRPNVSVGVVKDIWCLPCHYWKTVSLGFQKAVIGILKMSRICRLNNHIGNPDMISVKLINLNGGSKGIMSHAHPD